MNGNLSKIKGITFRYDDLTEEQKSDFLQAVLPEVKEQADIAANNAENAAKIANSIKNLSVTATEGKEVSVTQTETKDGIKLDFTLPRGEKGDKGEQDKAALSLYYYGDINITPSNAELFEFITYDETMTAAVRGKKDISGDVVVPYQCVVDGKTYVVDTIAHLAFCNRENVTSVIFPSSIKKANSQVFYNCPNLKSITVPNSITDLDYGFCYSNCGDDSGVDLYYRGTKEELESIVVDVSNRTLCLYTGNTHCLEFEICHCTRCVLSQGLVDSESDGSSFYHFTFNKVIFYNFLYYGISHCFFFL